MTKYTHAVAHTVAFEKNGKLVPVDELVYATDVNHAMAIAHQGMAAGWANIAIITLKEPTTLE